MTRRADGSSNGGKRGVDRGGDSTAAATNAAALSSPHGEVASQSAYSPTEAIAGSTVPPVASEDSPLHAVKLEINTWIEALTKGQHFEDPVFEGIVRDFTHFDASLRTVAKSVEKFLSGLDSLCSGMVALSEGLVTALTKQADQATASDCLKFREAAVSITRADAPHSILAKLRRDLEFNVATPLSAHLLHNKKLRGRLELRRRRYVELDNSRKAYQAQQEAASSTGRDARLVIAEANLRAAQLAFDEVDRPVFEWLMMLEEYKGDIYDSLVQTLKYLQYEFFAGAAHCISHVLPTRMEFRPLIEMTPEQLEPQVAMELADESGPSPAAEAALGVTMKLLEKWERTGTSKATDMPNVDHSPVDEMSLSLLVAQGFDEPRARQALRRHDNDTQAALDCMISGHSHDHDSADPAVAARRIVQKAVADSVRMPTTLKWVEKLKQRRTNERVAREATDNRDQNTATDDEGGDRGRRRLRRRHRRRGGKDEVVEAVPKSSSASSSMEAVAQCRDQHRSKIKSGEDGGSLSVDSIKGGDDFGDPPPLITLSGGRQGQGMGNDRRSARRAISDSSTSSLSSASSSESGGANRSETGRGADRDSRRLRSHQQRRRPLSSRLVLNEYPAESRRRNNEGKGGSETVDLLVLSEDSQEGETRRSKEELPTVDLPSKLQQTEKCQPSSSSKKSSQRHRIDDTSSVSPSQSEDEVNDRRSHRSKGRRSRHRNQVQISDEPRGTPGKSRRSLGGHNKRSTDKHRSSSTWESLLDSEVGRRHSTDKAELSSTSDSDLTSRTLTVKKMSFDLLAD